MYLAQHEQSSWGGIGDNLASAWCLGAEKKVLLLLGLRKAPIPIWASGNRDQLLTRGSRDGGRVGIAI